MAREAGVPGGYPVSQTGVPLVSIAMEVAQLVSAVPEAAPELARTMTSGGYPSPGHGVQRPPVLHAQPQPQSQLKQRTTASEASMASPRQRGAPTRTLQMRQSSSQTRHHKTGDVQLSQNKSSAGKRSVIAAQRKQLGSSSATPKLRRRFSEELPDKSEDHELTEARVLSLNPESEGIADVGQLLYRHKGLQSLSTPMTVDFSQLINLRVLSLSHNLLSNIEPVAELPSLLELNVNQNRITKLNPALHCEGLEVLLAARNRVASLELQEGEQHVALRRLSLFANELAEADQLLSALQSLPALRSLDIEENPCFVETSWRYSCLRALPWLEELDGEQLKPVDRQLADEFFMCAEELGFQERPRTATRPKTAPTEPLRGLSSASSKAAIGRPSRSPKQSHSSRTRSPSCKTGAPRLRAAGSRAASPSASSATEQPEIDPHDVVGSIHRYAAFVEAQGLRVHTLQVECENLRMQVRELRDAEPKLGAAVLRERVGELQAQNQHMHERNEANGQLRQHLDALEAAITARAQLLGLSEEAIRRPRSARPGSAAMPRTAEAAANAVLELTCGIPGPTGPAATKAELAVQNAALRQEIASTRQHIMDLRASTCSTLMGRNISPPPSRSGRH